MQKLSHQGFRCNRSLCNGGQRDVPAQGHNGGTQKSENTNGVEDLRALEHRRGAMEKDNTRSVSLLEQKRKVVSSSIDVPHARKSDEEVDMDKVTAAMVLTSLSTSPLVRSPPVKVTEGLNGSWKDGGFTPSSYSSSGFWSWSVPSDQSNPSNPSTPSPPLSADSFRPFRMSSLNGPQDDTLDEQDASNLLFDEPIPRKRKNSMKVMFKCLWKNCGKVLSTAAGIQRHIRTVHLGRNCDSECSDGEEDFYYTEIKLNTDSVADGLSSLSPASPSVLSPPPGAEHRRTETSSSTSGAKSESSSSTPLSRSAPSALYLVHTDHAYQATAPVSIPSTSSARFTPTSSSSFSVSWQSPPVTFTGTPASPTHNQTQGFSEQRPQTTTVLSSLPRASGSLSRKSRGEGKKCRKVYGMENRDMWCTACRWKKACQRFVD
ncbi:zinc finger protein 704 [Silurus asotus]|uniref:Zinc finger protein 704 n=1 Tax=Silurus asotus TaxID=30991 RepID=A0AAD5AS18_SILAS|nr:zinc finger protein 704 [Silurus asotus]